MDVVNAASPPGAGAALPRAKTGSGAAVNETGTDPRLEETPTGRQNPARLDQGRTG